MKCICKYDSEAKLKDGEESEDFIQVTSPFLNIADKTKRSGLAKAQMFACPKCMTLKIVR